MIESVLTEEARCAASKNQNPREGIEIFQSLYELRNSISFASKNQNPREGIEMRLMWNISAAVTL